MNQLTAAGYKVFYDQIGDYQVDHYYFEIGGKNKTAKQLKNNPLGYVVADGITTGFGRQIPLYLFGLLY